MIKMHAKLTANGSFFYIYFVRSGLVDNTPAPSSSSSSLLSLSSFIALLKYLGKRRNRYFFTSVSWRDLRSFPPGGVFFFYY